MEWSMASLDPFRAARRGKRGSGFNWTINFDLEARVISGLWITGDCLAVPAPGDEAGVPQLLAVASRLRDTAELFQSDEMRPANDPEERAPVRVRMLNDVLQGLEKSFLLHQAPPGLYRYGTRCPTRPVAELKWYSPLLGSQKCL